MKVIYEGDTYAAMADSTYFVSAKSIYNGCTSNLVQVVINRDDTEPNVIINQIQDLTDCLSPNGILEAAVLIDGIEVTDGYKFTWYIGSDIGSPVSLTALATNLSDINYSVEVEDIKSGCKTTMIAEVNSNIVINHSAVTFSKEISIVSVLS